MVDKPQWPLNSEVLRNYTLHMKNELGHNNLDTSFTGTSATQVPQIQEDNVKSNIFKNTK